MVPVIINLVLIGRNQINLKCCQCIKKVWQGVYFHKLPLIGSSYFLNFNTELSLKDSEFNETVSPTIMNYIGKKVGNKFIKMTEICLGKQTIVLKDIYEFNQESDQLSTIQETNPPESSPASQKTEEAEDDPSVPDKKNVVKNIVKGFGNWLDDKKKQGLEFSEAKRSLKQLLRRNRFNNKLIYKIIDREATGPLFYLFLTDGARQYISHSKIFDKQTSLKTIELYRKLYESLKTPISVNQNLF